MDAMIVNPVAGENKNLEYLEIIKNWYQEINRELIIVESKCQGHAKKLAQYYSHLPEISNIVSVGGDGTLNEITNGMIDTNKGLIIIPTGTGNDFYKSVFRYKEDFLCDVGKANDDYFLCILSVGLDAQIADLANKIKGDNVSGNVYIKALYDILPEMKDYRIWFESKNELINKRLLMISFCNTPYYGGGIKLAKNAKLDDGLFDTYVVDILNKYQVPILLAKIFVGIHEKDKHIRTFQTAGGTINFNQKMLYSFDGECRYADKIKLSLCRNKLLIKKDFNKEIKKLIKKRF